MRCTWPRASANDAEQAAEQAARRFPDAVEFEYQQAVADYMLGRSGPAIKILAPDEKPGEKDLRPVLLMAVLKSQSGDYQEASSYFERVEQMQAGCNALGSDFYGAALLSPHRPSDAQAELVGGRSLSSPLRAGRVSLGRGLIPGR